MIWIEYHKQNNNENPDENIKIPQELKYSGWRKDRDYSGETPLMLWIRRYEEPIPQELFYDGWQTDKNNDG